MLARAFSRAWGNLFLPGILKLLLLCLLAYVVGLFALAWGIGAFIASLAAEGQGFLWGMVGAMGGGIFAWFLFPLLFPVLIGFFDDYMAQTIERQDYPHVPRQDPPFWPTLWQDFKFSLKAIGINLLCLPLYLTGIGLIVYYGVNGYLLGSQFFYMSAGRHICRAKAEELREQNWKAILAGGVAISFFATIPLINLVVPLLGVATMLHFYHLLMRHDKQQVLEA